nr:hypothetical protein [Clostridium estertheticum]
MKSILFYVTIINKNEFCKYYVISTRYKGVTHGFISMDKITNKADEALIEISTYLKEKFYRKQI